MRLHERDQIHRAALAAAKELIIDMQCAIRLKIGAPYGDGTRSDQINASTDVLPQLRKLFEIIDDATNEQLHELANRSQEQ